MVRGEETWLLSRLMGLKTAMYGYCTVKVKALKVVLNEKDIRRAEMEALL